MAILGTQNPVILAGFDVLLFGKRGAFSSFARAVRVLVRSKGTKEPWTELVFTKRTKTKAQKEFALYTLLKKLSAKRDLVKKKKPKKAIKKKAEKKKAEPKPKRPKKLPKKPKPTDEEIYEELKLEPKGKRKTKITFREPVEITKVLTTRSKKLIEIKHYDFVLNREVGFATGNTLEVGVTRDFIKAVKEEFVKLYKKHGPGDYYVRIRHDYKGMPNYYEAYPDEIPTGQTIKTIPDKTFGGMSLNRLKYRNKSILDDQFDNILPYKYLRSFSSYLDFAGASSEFTFSGFHVEFTSKLIPNKKK